MQTRAFFFVEWASVMIGAQVLGAQATDATAAIRLAAVQIAVERSTAGLPVPQPLESQQFSVETLHYPFRLKIQRLTPWVLPHWHPYTVAIGPHGVHPLGGFSGPDLLALAAEAELTAGSDAEAKQVAKLLAALADPNGSGEILFHQDSLSDSATRLLWSRAARIGFPPDTIEHVQGGGIRVRLTVLSALPRQFPAAKQIVTLAFEFSASGRLTGWSARSGEHLYIPGG